MGQFNERPHAQITFTNGKSATLTPPGSLEPPNYFGEGFILVGTNKPVRSGPGNYLVTLETSNAIGPNELAVTASVMNNPTAAGQAGLTASVAEIPAAYDLPVPYTKFRVIIANPEGMPVDASIGWALRVDRVRVALPLT